MPPIRYLARSMPSMRRLNLRFVSTSTHLRQEAQLAGVEPPQAPLPPNPASGSPLYSENWRNATSSTSPGADAAAMLPSLGFLSLGAPGLVQSLATLDANGLMDQFAKWTTEQRWGDLKQLFELWIKSLDNSGKPNKPGVDLYNHYLRANLMMGASTGQLIDLVEKMNDYEIEPNTASFNLVLKAMQQADESLASEKLIERMLQRGPECKDSLPDDESYDLVITTLLSTNQINRALKYIDLALTSGYMLSINAFSRCVHSFINNGRLDTLVSLIERCKKMDQNKSLCPPWRTCNSIADVSVQLDNSDLTYYALEFMAKWIARGEIARPPVLLSVNEGLVLSALGTAGRTCNSRLVDGSWAVLKRSLRQKKVPSPESYIGKLYAHANLGNLQKAFSTLHEFEIAYKNSDREDVEELFSPFHSLNPLVIACSKKGFRTLDMVYHQLENLGQSDPPYKSIAALNCIILGSANIWDIDRAYQTFAAIDATFGLTPDIHSYNALLCAFGKLGKRDEAVRVFEHFTVLGVKPNLTTYSLLVDAHLVVRDLKAALASVDDMINGGFEPSKEMLKKIRRRCVREMNYESDDKVESLAQQFKIRMGTEIRRNMLFELEYNMDSYM
ncbi:pentatricopeptide repeat-containing protein At1g26460, mitochondrial-like [Salvia splendens]|uniref:pentatricopeptide repeat-containing protein At1g26460, mitochondrial-like n=1 Tax=Salvia splendens TaxID=180675 RepID=UPI001C27AA53|nr:pentatricopeptide repeat-containing protein At1g26460, mitochondrial-like [Salvia splendens]